MPTCAQNSVQKSSYPTFTNSGLEGLSDLVQTSYLQKSRTGVNNCYSQCAQNFFVKRMDFTAIPKKSLL